MLPGGMWYFCFVCNFFLSNPDDTGESFYNKLIYMHKEDNWDLRGFWQNLLAMLILVLFSPDSCSLQDCARARVWSDYYSSILISSWDLLKFWSYFSLADRKKQYTIGGKEVWSSYRSWYGKAIIKFQKNLQLCILNMIVQRLKGKSSEKTRLHESRHTCIC